MGQITVLMFANISIGSLLWLDFFENYVIVKFKYQAGGDCSSKFF
jgi:hypothetical protein